MTGQHGCAPSQVSVSQADWEIEIRNGALHLHASFARAYKRLCDYAESAGVDFKEAVDIHWEIWKDCKGCEYYEDGSEVLPLKVKRILGALLAIDETNDHAFAGGCVDMVLWPLCMEDFEVDAHGDSAQSWTEQITNWTRGLPTALAVLFSQGCEHIFVGNIPGGRRKLAKVAKLAAWGESEVGEDPQLRAELERFLAHAELADEGGGTAP